MFVDSLTKIQRLSDLLLLLSGIVNDSLKRSSISCKHVSLWCLFYVSHQTTHQS